VTFKQSIMLQVIYVVGVLKKRQSIPEQCPAAIKDLIVECWQDEPDCRPSFNNIVPRLEVHCLLALQICECAKQKCESQRSRRTCAASKPATSAS
jgi:hypothetical protein